jgi:DNA-binding response OmpR family regulator
VNPCPRVLVVDDETDMRTMLDAVLRRAGFEVESAADGQDALEAATARPPDLVITDILMPRLDGWQLCRRLRAQRATAAVPIIFLSLRSRAPDRIHGLQLGADDFIPKPFDTRELIARIRAVLKRAAQAAVSRAEAGISGNLRDMSLVDIAQVLDLGRKTARVRVAAPAPPADPDAEPEPGGALWFENGALTHAARGAATGTAALVRLLTQAEGRFEIVLGVAPPARTLSGTTQELLLQALRISDEARARGKKTPGAQGAAEARVQSQPAAPQPGGGAEAARTGTRPPRRRAADLSPMQPTLLDLFALGVIEPKE